MDRQSDRVKDEVGSLSLMDRLSVIRDIRDGDDLAREGDAG